MPKTRFFKPGRGRRRVAATSSQSNVVPVTTTATATTTTVQQNIAPSEKIEFDFTPIVAAISAATPADLQAALKQEGNGSALCKQLSVFRLMFNVHSTHHGFNPHNLQRAFEIYDEKFNEWYKGEGPQRWLRLNLFLRQVIGYVQRYLPEDYAQAFCSKLADKRIENLGLPRKAGNMELKNYVNEYVVSYYPLGSHAKYQLGYDFAVIVVSEGQEGRAVNSEVPFLYDVASFWQNVCREKEFSIGSFERVKSPSSDLQLEHKMTPKP